MSKGINLPELKETEDEPEETPPISIDHLKRKTVLMNTASAPITSDRKPKEKSKGFKTVKVKNSNKYRNGGSPKISNGMDMMDTSVITMDSMGSMGDIESYIMQQEEQRNSVGNAVNTTFGTPSMGSVGTGSVKSDSGQFGSEYTADSRPSDLDYDSSPDLDSSSFQVVKKEKPKRRKKRNKKRDKKDKKKRKKKKSRSAGAVLMEFQPEDCTIRDGMEPAGSTYSDMIVKKIYSMRSRKGQVAKVNTNPFDGGIDAIDELGGILDDHNTTNPFAKQKSEESISVSRSSTNPFGNEQEEYGDGSNTNPFGQNEKSTNPFFTDGDLP